MTWRHLANGLLSTLFEPPCAACGTRLDRPLDGAVCEACWSSIRPLAPPLCMRCGLPLPSWRVWSLDSARCPRCRRAPGVIDGTAAVGEYDGALRDIVHALKYGPRRSIAPRLSELMRTAGAGVLRDADLIVPVPLHPRREWTRGFNQAAVLARGLGPPIVPLLRRSVATRPQVGLTAAERRANVSGAFAFADRRRVARWGGDRGEGRVADAVVVLVDDVMTTGATLEACARVLREAGAREIRAVTAARAVTARP